jgi:hypothetical protein
VAASIDMGCASYGSRQVLLDVLVDVGVVGDRVDELVELLPARQPPAGSRYATSR